MAPAIGTLALIGGVVVVAGVAYVIYKNSQKQDSRFSSNSVQTKEDKYTSYKKTIEKAISENNVVILNEMLNSRRVKDFPDLIKMIEEALKGKE